ncbi:T9SS type A sorting domain-containing protein [candidate division TA06 bacterium]|uniref:T9SS type A sorting domain-containing protein n=1 Tax=candidate division TA06 bacterium TaxID=2250710 RepID=A0A933MKL6_UNCT6|nr:T9SS type A sorting domain-containing protein [candidate division TA06 bacterium]
MKRSKFIFAFVTLLLAFGMTQKVYAQPPDTLWTARYNGSANSNDEAQACALDDSGYVYVSGESYNGSNDDIFTIKYNPVTGDTVWTRRFNKSADGAYGCAVDGLGNLYVTGHSGSADITIKYNAINGDTVWTRSYNGPVSCDGYAYACAVDSAGNLYVVGESNYNGTNDYLIYKAQRTLVTQLIAAEDSVNYNYLTIKYNTATGDTIWTRIFDGSVIGGSYAHACAVDDSGNLYVTGYSYPDYLTIKYNADTGDTLWTARYYPGSSYSNAACVVDGSGNLYVVGYTYNGVNADYLTIKYDPVTGDTIWTLRYNGPDNSVDAAFGCAVDGSGNLYVTGVSSNGANYDYLTIKYNTSTGVEGMPGDSIQRIPLRLVQNSPNPFSHATTIKYQIPQAGNVSLKVYNVAGQLVKTLIDENSNSLRNREGREGSVTWDGRDRNNQQVSNGIYFYQLQAGDKQATKKLIKLK